MSATLTPRSVRRDRETGRVLLTSRERSGLRAELSLCDDLLRRAEIKTLLRIRRTGAETVVLARALLDSGLMLSRVADYMGIRERNLRRVLNEVRDFEKQASQPHNHAAELALSRVGKGNGRPRRFETFSELDAYLEGRA